MEKGNINTPGYWNNRYKDGFYQDETPENQKLNERFLDHYMTPSYHRFAGRTVLELGCGIAYSGKYLADRSLLVYCTDFSEKVIRENEKRFYPLDRGVSLYFIKSDVYTALKEPDGIDYILAFEILEHFRDPGKILSMSRKCLKDGGMFLFSVPHERGPDAHTEYHYSIFNYDNLTELLMRNFTEVNYFRNAGAYGRRIYGVGIK